MKMLKIGSLNAPKNRWNDASSVFDKIYVTCFWNEKENEKFDYIKFDDTKAINKIFVKIAFKLRYYKQFEWVENIVFGLWRVINGKYIAQISKLQFDVIHSSYNYFDDSAMLTILLKNIIKQKQVYRAYKETRIGYDYFEKKSLELANVVILNTDYTKRLLEDKYKNIFLSKEIITGVDEDYRSNAVIEQGFTSCKLSNVDHIPHVVILAGECTSDASIKWLGNRQFYIPLINDMIESGLIVHIHTLKIHNDKNGNNLYEKLKEKYPSKFYIESGLDFENNTKQAYEILGRYDFGVLHNLEFDGNVSEFDKINISHRFYEYQIAKVAPIVQKGTTIVEEGFIRKHKCGLIYERLNELHAGLDEEYSYFTPSFRDYIQYIYQGKSIEKI